MRSGVGGVRTEAASALAASCTAAGRDSRVAQPLQTPGATAGSALAASVAMTATLPSAAGDAGMFAAASNLSSAGSGNGAGAPGGRPLKFDASRFKAASVTPTPAAGPAPASSGGLPRVHGGRSRPSQPPSVASTAGSTMGTLQPEPGEDAEDTGDDDDPFTTLGGRRRRHSGSSDGRGDTSS